MKASFHHQVGAEDSALADALIADLRKAKSVDIAVAWLSKGHFLDALLEVARKGVPVRICVGLQGYNTHPDALQHLVETLPHGCARVWDTTKSHLFHHKVYTFEMKGKTTVWVGSLNATYMGFEQNWESAVRLSPVEGQLANGLGEFQRSVWTSCVNLNRQKVAQYRTQWKPVAARRRKRQKAERRQLRPVAPVTKAQRTLLGSLDWKGYYGWLIRREGTLRPKWEASSILTDPDFSYLQTIDEVQEILLRTPLTRIGEPEAKMILGFTVDGWDYGLLGSMEAAVIMKRPFIENLRGFRDRVLSICRSRSLWRDPETALKGVLKLWRMKGVGSGVATRCGAIVRPDLLASLNDASASQFSRWSGIPVGRLKKNDSSGYAQFMRQEKQLDPEITQLLGPAD
ncbi:MAG: phospholipase D-like domain-containing protein [Planctomycetota bacterium]|jgi:HKD family nuclease